MFTRSVDRAGGAFEDTHDRDTFVELVWEAAALHSWECLALCVLRTHYHLVLEARTRDLSAGLRRLNWQYARFFTARRGSFGHVFASRYGARLIEAEQYLHEACSYVVLNPVRAGLCDRAEDWPWSYSVYGLAAA